MDAVPVGPPSYGAPGVSSEDRTGPALQPAGAGLIHRYGHTDNQEPG
jgi:hypothetical protein